MKTLRLREEDSQGGYCIVDSEAFSIDHVGWYIASGPTRSNCTQALCTQQAQTSVDITQISSQGMSISSIGYWFGTLFITFPPNGSLPFAVQVDGETLDVFQKPSNFDFNHNIFTITGSLANRDGGHTFKFTNLQSATTICLLDAQFDAFGITTTESAGAPTETKAAQGTSFRDMTKVKLLVILISICVPACILCITFWLIRRRIKLRRSEGSLLPDPLTDIKLDGEEQPPRYSAIHQQQSL